MWDIDRKYLQSDERIEYTDQPTRSSCAISYVWAGGMLFMFLVSLGGCIVAGTMAVIPVLLVYIVLATPALVSILKRMSTRYAITSCGLIIRKGVFTDNVKTVPFKHITSVEVTENTVGRIFRYASLIIETSGSGKAIELRWDYVGAAHNVKKLIEQHVGG